MTDPKSMMGYLMMMAGGGAIVYVFAFIKPRVRTCNHWPSVRGEIIKSGVLTKPGTTGFDNPNTFYQADVAYRYSVANRTYIGTDIRPGGSIALSVPRQAHHVAATYVVGHEVEVFYNPDRPDESYLERTDNVSWMYILIGMVFIFAGWFLL